VPVDADNGVTQLNYGATHEDHHHPHPFHRRAAVRDERLCRRRLFRTGESARQAGRRARADRRQELVRRDRRAQAPERRQQRRLEQPDGYSLRKAPTPDFAGAGKFYDEALRIDPRHRGALEYSGELYLQTGDLARAEQRLAALDKACFLPCAEYSDLKKAIAQYKANGGKVSSSY